jgi:hypothetical protein
MGIRLEVYLDKLKEINCNIEAISKSVTNSRYLDIMDKNGIILEEQLDQEDSLNELILFKNSLLKEIKAMQDSTEML